MSKSVTKNDIDLDKVFSNSKNIILSANTKKTTNKSTKARSSRKQSTSQKKSKQNVKVTVQKKLPSPKKTTKPSSNSKSSNIITKQTTINESNNNLSVEEMIKKVEPNTIHCLDINNLEECSLDISNLNDSQLGGNDTHIETLDINELPKSITNNGITIETLDISDYSQQNANNGDNTIETLDINNLPELQTSDSNTIETLDINNLNDIQMNNDTIETLDIEHIPELQTGGNNDDINTIESLDIEHIPELQTGGGTTIDNDTELDTPETPQYQPSSPQYQPVDVSLSPDVNKEHRVIVKSNNLVGVVKDGIYTFDPITRITYANVIMEDTGIEEKISTEELMFEDVVEDTKNIHFMPPYQKNMLNNKNNQHLLDKYIKLEQGDLKNLIGQVIKILDNGFVFQSSHPCIREPLKIAFDQEYSIVTEPPIDKIYRVDSSVFWSLQENLNNVLFIINNCNEEKINGHYQLLHYPNNEIEIDCNGSLKSIIKGPFYKHRENNIVIKRDFSAHSFKSKIVIWYIYEYDNIENLQPKTLYYSCKTEDFKSMLVPLHNWNIIESWGKRQCIGNEPYPKIKKIEINKDLHKPIKPSFETKKPLTTEYISALKQYHNLSN